MIPRNAFLLGNCLEWMKEIPDQSIDMVLADLPYGTTPAEWDKPLDLPFLWKHYWRIAKPAAPIVLFSTPPFTADLIQSERKHFQLELIWHKSLAANFFQAHRRPLKKHENILIFYRQQPTYHPQMLPGKPYKDKARKRSLGIAAKTTVIQNKAAIDNPGTRFPESVIFFPNSNHKGWHSTPKPEALLEWLIKTYSNEGDLILDNVAGSGTTAVACLNTKRDYILIEKDEEMYVKASQRIQAHKLNLTV